MFIMWTIKCFLTYLQRFRVKLPDVHSSPFVVNVWISLDPQILQRHLINPPKKRIIDLCTALKMLVITIWRYRRNHEYQGVSIQIWRNFEYFKMKVIRIRYLIGGATEEFHGLYVHSRSRLIYLTLLFFIQKKISPHSEESSLILCIQSKWCFQNLLCNSFEPERVSRWEIHLGILSTIHGLSFF